MNSIIISGRLCRDPEVRYSGTGESTTAIARFTVAVNRRSKRENAPDADFFTCTAFGKNANFAEKYLKQGSKVVVRGAMEQDNYTNKDGQKVYSFNLKVDEIDFGEGKPSGESEKPKASGKSKPAAEKPVEEGYMEIPEDESEFPFA